MLKRLLLTTALVAAPLWAAHAGFLDIFSSLTATGGSNTYYVDSVSGNDSNTGLSPGVAWKTATPVSAQVYNAGDKVLFNGGQTFTGPVTLSAAVNYSATPPTQAQPLILDSYGTGNATIHITTTSTDALHLTNIGSITVQNLIITGSGAASQKGLRLSNTTTTTQYSDVNFNNVEVSGMSSTGMQVEADGDTSHGFTNLAFNGVNIHSPNAGNTSPGLFIAGFFPYQWTSAVYDHQNVTISNSIVTGAGTDGVDFWNVNGGTISNNRFHGNGAVSTGADANSEIEFQASTNVTFQFNEVDHHAFPTGDSSDGNGINIDRGSSNITAQYNWVHDNAGAGITVFQGSTGIAMSGITVRYNITQNNGTAGSGTNDPCEIILGATGGLAITGLNVYNNTFYSSLGAANVNSIVLFNAANITGTFKNNILQGTANPRSINAGTFNPTTMTFLGNDYFGTTKILWNNVSTTTIGAWGQDASAVTASPALTSPGTGGTTNGYNPGSLSAYLLANGSPATGVGQVIASPGAQDFFGHTIPNSTGTGYNIGADGSSPAAAVPAAPIISSPAQGATVSTAVATISGTGGTTGDTINITLDGVTTTSATTVSANAWTYHTGSLSNASHSVSATETNITGTSVASGTTTFTTNVPAVPPAPVVLGPTGTVSTTVATVNGTGAANGDTITVKIDSAACSPACTTTVAANLSWTLNTPALSNGAHAATAIETNATGPSLVSNTQNFTTNVVTPTTSTFDPDPSKTTTTIALSNGNLTSAVLTAGTCPQTLSTTSHQTGKWHYEIQLTGSGNNSNGIGLANGNHLLTNCSGIDTNSSSIAWYGNTNNGIFWNNVNILTNTNLQFGLSGDLLALEVDFDNHLFWVQDITKGSSWNGNNANPGTGTGGASFTVGGVPWFAVEEPVQGFVAGRSQTANFGGATFTATCSTGFTPWNGSATACPTGGPTSGTGLSAAASLLPADLPVTHWHTTARPWSPLGVTAANYLTRLNSMVAWLTPQLNGSGCLGADPFPYYSAAAAGTGGALPMSIGAQLKAGDTTNISAGASSPGVMSMNCDALTFSTANGQDAGFQMGPLNLAYQLYGANGGASVTAGEKSTWAGNLNHYVGQGTNVNNQTTFGMWGAWLAIQNNLSAYTSAGGSVQGTNGIDCEWIGASCPFNTNTINQSAAFNDSPFGLYQDSTAVSPNSLQVERQSTTLLLMSTEGYSGAQAGAITTATQKAAHSGLLMQSPDGSNAVGGRVDNHAWVDGGRQLTDDIMAQQLVNSNPFLAGQYQHAAYMAYTEVGKYLNTVCCGSGTFFQVKNHFNPSLSLGSQFAGGGDYGYNTQQMYFLAGSYLYRSQGVVTEQPAPAEIGGYAFFANGFSQAVLAAGGTSVQLATSGQTVLTPFDQPTLWTALGIERIGRVNWETRIGPSDSGYLSGLGTQTSFAPTWITSGTSWTRLAQNPGNCTGNFTTTFANPAVTFGKVVWTCTTSPAVTFTQNLTVTPDGVMSQTTCSGCPSTWGTTVPILTNDGTSGFGNTVTTTDINSTENGVVSVTWPPTGDSQNFMTYTPSGTTTAFNEGTQSAVSGILQSERVWTGSGTTPDATQIMFIYPKSSGDPSATGTSGVHKTFTPTGTNTYTDTALSSSVVSGTNGTYYVGRTAAGGWATQVTSPSLIFSAPCNFIAQINGAGHVTTLEVDRTVTATVQGAPPVQMSTNVQHSF